MASLPTVTEHSAQSVPRNTEEGRALLQSRLAQSGRLGAVIAAVFLLLGGTAAAMLTLEGSEFALGAEAGSLLVSLAAASLSRVRPLSGRALIAIDVAMTWLNCAFFVALGFTLPTYARPELVQLLCIADLLAVRAFLVPSSARRTALVGAVPSLLVVLSTWFIYRAGVPHPQAPDRITYTVLAAILALAPLVITTLTSRTIFGLRERAREAMQLGQYTLLEKIGAGGMGIVYKARHATLRRPTAIKLLPAERAGAHNLVRFEREVQLTSQLTHPNTIAIYDYGRSADGLLYYAMEYLDGIDLESLVELDGPQVEARVVHILEQVCAALAEAHGAGLLHRDIKPQNVLLCSRGGVADVAKVLDFGLVKELARPSDASTSSVDMIIGTPLYMSPEAIARPQDLDARSDLYAVGALGYFMLTGLPPFTGGSVVEICGHHLHTPPMPPSQRAGRSITPALDALILACLHKQPQRRPESAAALRRQLLALQLSWSEDERAGWWRSHAGALAELKRQRSTDQARASTIPIETLAVDLQARSRLVSTPWQSSAQPREEP